ncbi:MAG TPA: choice-of-anchor V domain-containing protein [Bryobacteraceae bacterium]|nr:choice-of-anchor V domain-containing protein [Bryobacteraceae bacterium]
MIRLAASALLVILPVALFAESDTPGIGYAGAPTDHGGANCSTCHNTFGGANSDKTGSLHVTFSTEGGVYMPGQAQTIRIVVERASAANFGFQITIREQNNLALSAGTFAIPTGVTAEQVVCADGSEFGSPGPCAGNMPSQFAEHQKAPASSGSYEFDVLWTPPAQEIGRLNVYVAAVAANEDGTPQGDYVYTFTQTLNNAGTCALPGTPAFHNVANAASFQPGFSSGSLVSIFGTNFQTSGRQRIAGPGDYVNGGYPTELGCVGVEVTGPGISQPVSLPITYANFGQINAQMPQFSGSGPIKLTITLNPGSSSGVPSDVATIDSLQNFSPAFFLFPNSTSIAAEEAATGSIVADPKVVAGASPAKHGDIVALYGTGFGDVTPTVGIGALASGQAKLTTPVTITIGGTTLASSDVLYAGLSPGSISGLYQFNVRIPSSAPSGDVPVSIAIGGVETQAATIPVQ